MQAATTLTPGAPQLISMAPPSAKQLEFHLFTSEQRIRQTAPDTYEIKVLPPRFQSPTINSKAAAKIIGCSVRAVQLLAEAGDINHSRIPRHNLKFDTLDVYRYKEQQTRRF